MNNDEQANNFICPICNGDDCGDLLVGNPNCVCCTNRHAS